LGQTDFNVLLDPSRKADFKAAVTGRPQFKVLRGTGSYRTSMSCRHARTPARVLRFRCALLVCRPAEGNFLFVDQPRG